MQNTELNSSFLSLLFFAMALSPIVLVVTFYIFRILVYKFCFRLTPQEKHKLIMHSPACFVSMILFKWLFVCGFDDINILLPVFESAMVTRWANIPQSLNDKKKFQNQFKRSSYDNMLWNCDVKRDRKIKLFAPIWWTRECCVVWRNDRSSRKWKSQDKMAFYEINQKHKSATSRNYLKPVFLSQHGRYWIWQSFERTSKDSFISVVWSHRFGGHYWERSCVVADHH